MPNLDFPYTFPYGYLERASREPVLPIRLILRGEAIDLQVLVDTGAERTLLEGVHLRPVGIDIFRGNEVTFKGFLGSGMVAYEHPARLQVAGIELDMSIAFSTQPMSRQVLGRDVLEYLILGIREKALELYVSPEG